MRLIVNRDEAQTFIDMLREDKSPETVSITLTMPRKKADEIIGADASKEIVMVWPSPFSTRR